MTQKSKPRPSESKPADPVIVFGLDDHGKPKAARFPEKQADLATKAAAQLKLRVLPVSSPEVADLGARLAVGRIYSNGRGFVPYVRRDLYDKLEAAAGAGQPQTDQPTAAPAPGKSATIPTKPPSTGVPLNWDDIVAGHLVVVQDSLDEGWYDAIVTERTGDMLTVRWPDYPRERRATVHRCKVGLTYPNLHEIAPNKTAPNGPKQANSGRDKSKPTSAESALPATWKDIDVNALVLARDDGPWKSWWEAIPIERNGDSFTLRWRDHGKLPPVIRHRFSLALICPNPQ